MMAMASTEQAVQRPVVVAAGGTGGHVVPALAVAEVLETHGIPVIWMGTKTGLESRMVPERGIDIRWINISGLRGKSLLSTLLAPVRLLGAIVQSMALLLDLKPRAVLGMGGFVSGPVGIAALLLRKPLVLHEQNAVAGMTNRWLSPLASRVFSAFPNAFKASINAQVVGNPVLSAMADVTTSSTDESVEREHALRILIVGGSRGASILNEIVPLAVASMSHTVAVRHQSGAGQCEAVQSRYADAAKHSIEVSDFIDNMAQAYQQADVVVCRSGAMTVTELSALGVPSILIPFPFAVDDHQSVNARFLADAGAAIVMPQPEFTADNLAMQLTRLADDPAALKSMGEAARRCFMPHAAQAVADAIMEVSS